MLNNIEQTRMDRLVYLVGALERYTKNKEEVLEYIRVWGGPECTIKYLRETLECKNYPEIMYEYTGLNGLKMMFEEFIPIVKDEIYIMMKADFDKGWITITDENCEEITNKLNKEISIEMDAERITKEMLKTIKK